MACCPSEMIPLTGTVTTSLASVSRAAKSSCEERSLARASTISKDEHFADDPEDFMPHIWLQAIDGQDRSSLLLHSHAQMVLVLHMQRNQLVVAMEQMLDGA